MTALATGGGTTRRLAIFALIFVFSFAPLQTHAADNFFENLWCDLTGFFGFACETTPIEVVETKVSTTIPPPPTEIHHYTVATSTNGIPVYSTIVENNYITNNPTTIVRQGSGGGGSSDSVSLDLFQKQVDRIYDSLSESVSAVSDDLEESLTDIAASFTTALLTVTGNASIGGNLDVIGTLTAGSLSVSSVSSGGAVEAPYFTATSTTQASTFPYASTTAISSSYASSTNAFFGNLSVGSLSGVLKATAGAISAAAVNLATEVSGVLAVANGGTGWASIASGFIPYGNGGSALATSTALSFDGTKFITTYASTTALTVSGSTYLATSGGNVGIGTTNPTALLHVAGAGIITGTLTVSNNTGIGNGYVNAGSYFKTSSTGYFAFTSTVDPSISGDTFITRGGASGKIYIGTTGGGSNGTLIAGNIGIGTTSPLGKLDVYGGDLYVSTSNSNYYLQVDVNASSGDSLNLVGPGGNTFLQFDNTTGVPLTLGVAGGTTLLNGNVGIGTTTPPNKLSITTTADGQGITFDSNGTIIGSLGRITVGSAVSLALNGVTSRPISINSDNNGSVLMANGGGNVGIGTTSPATRLTVFGTSASASASADNGILTVYGSNTAQLTIGSQTGDPFGMYLQAKSYTNNGTTYPILLNPVGGNVGIGTTGPNEKLEVTGSRMIVSDGAGTDRRVLLFVSPTSGSDYGRIESYGYGTSGGGKSLVLNRDGGNVGIGTTTPAQRLHVATDSNSIQIPVRFENANTGNAVEARMQLVSGTAIGQFQLFGSGHATTPRLFRISGSSDGGDMRFATLGNDQMTITSTGNVGIGTTNPGQKLEVSGGSINIATANNYLRVAGNAVIGANGSAHVILGSTGVANDFIFQSSGSTGNVIATFKNSGNVGIGTTSPSSKLSVTQSAQTAAGGFWLAASDNTDFRSQFMSTAGILSFYGGDTGGTLNTATLNAAGEWTNASDIAYKENVEDLSYGLDTVLALQPRSYDIKDTNDHRIGFIAQEVELLIPEVVGGVDGSKGISYGNLVAVAFKAIQDLYDLVMSRFAAQDTRIDTLEERIRELEARQGIAPPTDESSPEPSEDTSDSPLSDGSSDGSGDEEEDITDDSSENPPSELPDETIGGGEIPPETEEETAQGEEHTAPEPTPETTDDGGESEPSPEPPPSE